MKKQNNCCHISSVFKQLSDKFFYLYILFFRKSWLSAGLKVKKKFSERYKFSRQNKKDIKRVWGNVKQNPDWQRFYNSIVREETNGFDARYIPLDIQYCYIDDWFNNTQVALAIDDKNMYDLYFHDVNLPKTVMRIIDHKLFDANYCSISLDCAVGLCKSAGRVILKPAVDSSGGHGIEFWSVEDGEDKLKSMLSCHYNYIIQELIHQHPQMNAIYDGSVNSIRVVTCHYEGVTSVLSAVVRFGSNGAKLDNASLGGMFCGIKDDGRLKKYAYKKDGTEVEKHPQGAIFSECQIPNYDKCKELVIRLSNRFLRISKLISWDLAVDENGDPVIIEVNLCYGGSDIHQIANGPLYGDKTENIIRQVFKNRKYKLSNKLF